MIYAGGRKRGGVFGRADPLGDVSGLAVHLVSLLVLHSHESCEFVFLYMYSVYEVRWICGGYKIKQAVLRGKACMAVSALHLVNHSRPRAGA